METTDVYKYLGVIECTTIKHEEMKNKVLCTFKKRIKSILKSELNATRLYTRAEVACGWAGAAKIAKRDRSAKKAKCDRQTDRPTDGQSGS